MAQIILRSITPKNKIFDLDKFDRESAKTLNDIIKKAEREFDKTVATWSRKPEFKKEQAKPNKLMASVYTDNEIYGYVVRGTKPHVITPKAAPALRFQPNFTSKTIPRRITSRRGGRSGRMVSAKIVRHPGTQARDFDIVIADMLQPELVKEVRNDIKRATP
jgi:hypothetical protein